MKTFRRFRGPAGLTLLELLCAIAVVLVLAALLFPLLAHFRKVAQNVRCAGNLRQIGIALQAYTSDHDGRLIPAAVIRSNLFWFDELNPYMGFPNYGPQSTFPDAAATNTVFPLPWQFCPAQKTETPERQEVGYGWNYTEFGYTPSKPTTNPNSNLRQVAEPARTIIIGDSRDSDAQPGTAFQGRYLYSDTPSLLARRHGGKGNYLMLDGHVEALSPKDLPANSPLWKKIKPPQ